MDSDPTVMLEHLQKAFNKFVWDNKKAVLASRNRHKRSLGIPNLQYYYIVAQLCQLAAWNGEDDAPALTSIEQELMNVKYARNVLWTKRLITQNQSNPIISHSLKLWRRFGTKHKMISPSNPAQSFLSNPNFVPGLSQRIFSWWEQNNPSTIYSLTKQTTLLSVQQLTDLYNMPSQETFHNLQI
ncbi:hypothetical protein XELAEV_18000163mg [Xenopus laevis]|uniref:Uncharacterized protein n=1 Tax=Xenopus laevis TaxID=8355 RepID=A0A974BQL9_XENLA|nr:hypothetical protein XELAEV_18000163mg [Xenopus laevis]